MKQTAIHHTASRNTGRPQLYAVDRYHKEKWGMKSSLGWYVAYNVFCDTDGTITQTRSYDEETIANKGHNCDVPERCDTVSFCFAGDFNHDLPTQKQIDAFRRWRDTSLEVTTHRAIQVNRTCPGLRMTDEYIQTVLCPNEEDLSKEQIASFIKQLDSIRALLNKLIQRWNS